ncbi:MAG: hypothetical protein PHT62_06905 [Desulfotomaculaceae bacterium]|nr:hypothetical protein [Desulfotomaculaceae bacterium]
MSEITTEVLEAVKRTAKEGRISCTEARKLAEELNVQVRVVGDAADKLKVKLISCELGCF